MAVVLQRTFPVKNRMREICTSGTVRGEGGNRLTYSTFAAQGHGANLPFEMIGINGHVGIGEKHFQGDFPYVGQSRRFRHAQRVPSLYH